MPAISPRIASDVALQSYEIKKTMARGRKLPFNQDTTKNFSFDLTTHVYKGTSGVFFWRQETGFALIGQGKSALHKQDTVIAIRGTASLADALTDLTCHTKTSDTGSAVHTGFQSSFASLRPGLYDYLNQPAVRQQQGIIHCVGHSLGGALAALAADWIKTEFGKRVYLYTFGCPRVGLKGFAINTSSKVDKMFRCVHGHDPVPKVPVWPFYHAPFNGHEYILSREQGINPGAHSMTNGPGYIHSASYADWDSLHCQRASSVSQRVVLNYNNRLQTTYSTHWAGKISAALMTVMIDGGAAALVASLQAGGVAIGTVYDLMARSLVKIVEIAAQYKEQIKALLGCMLVFAGKGAYIDIQFTEQFIRWVFRVSIGRLNKAANSALKQN